MDKRVMTVFVLGIFLFVPFCVNSQEDAPGVFRTQEEMEKAEEEGINSGWVVAYGVLLKRPYLVEFRDDTVTINGIPWFPRREESDSMKHKISPQSAFYKKILDTYVDCYLTSGKETAEEKVLQKFASDTLVSKMVFDPETDDLIVTWSNGLPEVLYLQEGLAARYGGTPSQEEIRSDAAQVARTDLERGSMIVFGSNYSKIIKPKSAQQIIVLINDTKNGHLSAENAKTALSKYVNTRFADDIVNNIDNWK